MSTYRAYTLCLFSLLSYSCTPEPDQKKADTTENPVLMILSGVEADGQPTAAWIEAIRGRHDEAAITSLQETQKHLTAEEKLWANLIKSKSSAWPERIDALSVPFDRINPPDTITILLGNAGGEDAFTDSDTTIGFDLSKLHQIYGSASTRENSDRIERFFSHEMTHVLHKVWRKKHPVTIDSPLEHALWDCLVEGIGNYRSLSSKWVSTEGVLTTHAEEVLTELQPVFTERLLALENATEAEAVHLLKDLSSGPFTKKWGALTSALWLAQEAKGDDARLQPWIEAGPWGILDLADKYLPPSLAQKLSSIEKP